MKQCINVDNYVFYSPLYRHYTSLKLKIYNKLVHQREYGIEYAKGIYCFAKV